MRNKILQGDCLIKLKELEDNSIDSIVTDPPYELGFMGKSWDNTGIANNPLMWAECLRVLKPGGHLLAFSGTRTYHRMASAIEDAGFEVRDMIEWVYGSGFPKSLNIGKAVDKLQGNERENLGAGNTSCEYLMRGEKCIGHGSAGKSQSGDTIHTESTKGTSEWEGWGTALKPAHEPICMARKPLAEKTVAENVLKYGTGGINIDESRVGAEQTVTIGRSKGGVYDIGLNNPDFTQTNNGRFPANLIHDNSEEVRECFPETKSGKLKSDCYEKDRENDSMFAGGENFTHKGYEADSGNASRFFKSIESRDNYYFCTKCNKESICTKPTQYKNCPCGADFPEFKSIIYQAKASKSERNKGCEGLPPQEKVFNGQSDKPSTEMKDVEKRFTTLPKANNHPTVKPIALMEYLIKMVTPAGGTVLDPFAGSGSTLVAAKQNGFQYIGIEMTEEYIPIIEARLNSTQVQNKLL